jgi:ribonuclease BN (tRNA processing enzyme)
VLVCATQVLIHEATLESSLERVARSRGHSTPLMAANYAKHINVRPT